jgi:pyridoxal 5'-phosphate synthase glutaminase subunit Pdx2
MQVGVLGLQGDFREHLAMLRSLGANASDVRRPEDVERIDGLVIPGGESTTMGKLMVDYHVDEAIARRFAEGKLAIYGTCAGMILLARDIAGYRDQFSLGLLDVTVQRNAFGHHAYRSVRCGEGARGDGAGVCSAGQDPRVVVSPGARGRHAGPRTLLAACSASLNREV